MTTDTTIDRLREYFVTYGVPSVIVSDRGVQFTSDQFREFVRRNNIMHKMGAPYHPATNGQAERFVQTFKEKLKALKCERKDVQFELYKILMAYRRTVHPVTGKSPSMLVYGRQMKSRLDLLVPVADLKVSSRGEEEPVRCFTVNERVAARDFLGASKWQFGTVTERLGKLHYLIELDDGRIWKRHVDQMRAGPVQRNTEAESGKLFFDRPRSTSLAQSVSVGENGTVTRQQTPVLPTPNIKISPVQEAASTRQSVERVQSETRVNRDVVDRPPPNKNETPRRSTRVRKPSKRLDL
nr:uncharacterized protein K02A2.6-like [Aedes albopictus]